MLLLPLARTITCFPGRSREANWLPTQATVNELTPLTTSSTPPKVRGGFLQLVGGHPLGRRQARIRVDARLWKGVMNSLGVGAGQGWP